MASYPLLNGNIDRGHRGTLMESGTNLDVLITRTPKSNWMIHPSWVDRLSWAGLLPLARLVEGTLDEWVDHPELDEAGEPMQLHKRYSRVGGNKSQDSWLRDISPYVDEWTTTPTNIWDEVRAFDWDKFGLYLQRYRHSTRIYLVPSSAPDHIEAPLTSDLFPTTSVVGTRHHAGDLTCEVLEEVSSLMQRFERGDNIPPREHVSWLRGLHAKVRGIYAAVTCRRPSDVAIPRPAHRPPRPSLQRSEPRTSVHHSEPRPSVQRSEPRPAGSSSWQQTPPSQPGSSSWQQTPPSQPGSSSWQQTPPSQPESYFYQQPPPSQPGGSSWLNQMDLVGSQSQPFMTSVQSPMFTGPGSFLDGDGDDDDRASNTYDFSETVLATPPPWTQETQTQTDEAVYGHGHRETRPAHERLSPSGPRPRKPKIRRRPQQ